MSIYRELAYDRPICRVKGVQFCILSPDEIRRRSVCEVTQNQTYVGNEPVANGLFDMRMGVIDNNRVCTTCHQRNTFCMGHAGHITLARPVFYVQFFDTVRKLLRCVCYRCSRLLVHPDAPEVRAILGRKMSNQRRWEAMTKLCQKVRRCGGATGGNNNPDADSEDHGCGARQPDAVTKVEEMVMRIRLLWRDANSGDVDDARTAVGDDGDEDDEAAAVAAAEAAEAEAEEARAEEEARAATGAAEDNDDDPLVVAPPAGEDGAAAANGAAVGGGGGAAVGLAIRVNPNGSREVTLTAEDVLRILRRISDVDAAALGLDPKYNRPEWMICQVLPVAPPAVRPSVRHDTGQRQEDDLTHKLSDIIKYNNLLADKITKGSSAETVDQYLMLLQYHVATLVDNSVPNLQSKDRAGRLFRSITERLKNKDGRIRGNLMGKRVDFSARTVITPDPNLSIDELGVPLRIAMNLTFPEVVNVHNRARMQALVLAGPDVYPGAKHVRKTAQDNRTIHLRGNPNRASLLLDDGDVVERHLLDGDYVLFNRQPSLHKMSMMAHRVRVMDFNTFRLNVCVCASYNADFDGDEMNMHVPQSLQTHHELQELAAVPLHILSPRYSKPIITIVQDVALGVYRITQPHVRVTQRQLFNLVASNPLLRPALLPKAGMYDDGKGGDAEVAGTSVALARWSGRQVMSTVIPPAVSVRMSSGKDKDAADYDPSVDEVIIAHGDIRSGVVSKDVFTQASRGLVHAAYNMLGPAPVTAMLNNTQKIICDWLVLNGFSVGVSDLIAAAPDTPAKVRAHLDEAKANVQALLERVHAGAFENVSTKNDAEFLQVEISSLLQKGADAAAKACGVGYPATENRILNMINSGSKGNQTNFNQMVSCLGIQHMEGGRVPDGFDHRTLPHFCKYDDGPEARGFVEHSFTEGLSPHEFFFHSMAGRIGLIDTAVRTSETGYLQRRLVKAMEDCKIQHDLTVRNANGFVVQFLYGEDGMDAIKLEYQKLPYIESEPSEMRKPYLISCADDLRGHVRPALLDQLRASEAQWRPRAEAHFRAILDDRRDVIVGLCKGLRDNKPIVYPVHVQRIVENAAELAVHAGCVDGVSDLDPRVVLDTIDVLANELHVGSVALEAYEGRVRWMPLLLRAFLSPKVLIVKHRLNSTAFSQIVRQIRTAFYDAVASPGEMVGIVAAQSLGEPTTQLALNSVVHETPLLLRFGAKELRQVTIGEFVDAHVDGKLRGSVRADKDLEAHPNDTWLGWLRDDVDGLVEVLSCDTAGRISWRRVEAVTKHPVINADGSDTLLKVTLRSGRQVTATKAKSFLKRVNNEIVGVDGADLKVGDCLPVSRVLPVTDGMSEVTHLDVASYLPKTEFMYVSEADKAAAVSGEKLWWSRHHGKSFTLPYRRSDTFLVAYVQGKNKQAYAPGCVYPRVANRVPTRLPERIPLDEDFGFFLGAYLAEGHANKYHVIISNVDAAFRARADAFCAKYGVVYHTVTRHINNGVSTDMRLTSSVLATLLRRAFGGTSAEKRIPAQLLAAPLPFLRQVLNGYFSGDGTVAVDKAEISASSTSKPLLLSLQQMLLRFDVVSTVRPHINRQTCFKSPLKPTFKLYMFTGNAVRFAKEVGLVIADKQDRLDDIADRTAMYTYGLNDVIPDVVLSSGTISVHRDKIPALMETLEHFGDVEVLLNVLDEEILYDEILTIEEVRSEHPYVYDLTVEGTRNFNTADGLCQKDTFHSTGQAAATAVTTGVPRMRELMSVSKKIKTPAMRICLRPEWATSQERANEVKASIQTTYFRDLVRSSAVFYDPLDADTTVEEDRGLLAFYREYSVLAAEEAGAGGAAQTSPWVLRMEFDRMKMLDIQVTMLDIECALVDFYSDSISCVLSDDNASRLISRVRLANTGDTSSNDLLTEIKALEQSLMETLVIKGIPGINKAITQPPQKALSRYDPVTDAYVDNQEWAVLTDGSNLLDVMCHDHVDPYTTSTNDVYEVYTRLGIEAARAVLIQELRLVMSNLALDHRHLALLGDAMTNRGFFMSIDRHGINNRGELGPLAKCSFEQSDVKLIQAGVFSERDRINGVSANIMLGQIAPCGTGDCEVLLDNERIMKSALAIPLDVIAVPFGDRVGNRRGAEQDQQQRANGRGYDVGADDMDDDEDDDGRGPLVPVLEMPQSSASAAAVPNGHHADGEQNGVEEDGDANMMPGVEADDLELF